jgi:Tol biopolymer transport system component
MNADGSGQRPLVATSDLEAYPAWSPDGRWIAFTSIPCDERFCSWSRVLRVRPDGTGLSQLFTDGRRPLWSRDGRRLLIEAFIDPYGEAQSLVVLPSNGGSANQVVDERTQLANWSADGKSIGFSTYDYDRDEHRAWILDVRTERKQALEKYGRVLFSPRGSRMLAEAKTGVFVLTPGRRGIRLPRGSFRSWSPKGARLAYEFKHDLYVIGADGRSRRRVLRFPKGLPELPPYVWSPNGRRIYYTRATPSG